MKHFTSDNTLGIYTQAELDKMNETLAEQMSGINEDYADYEQILKSWAMSIIADRKSVV
jgi:hypothetical protein